MQDAWLGRLFVRFRSKRDGRALAAVFDATARELLAVAAHLVPTADQAEDVLQTTFQRAIERAEHYDPARSLKGWLYGILWREAARLTRVERRAPPPGALEAAPARAPDDEAAERELPDAVRHALARLPSPYREVVEPALFHDEGAREIGARLARSPGTVRVQLQRGLERLRRELPGAQRELAGRRAFGLLGLAGLREHVLARAGLAGSAVPAASAAFLWFQLASVALPPVAWAGVALVGVAGAAGAARHARTGPATTEERFVTERSAPVAELVEAARSPSPPVEHGAPPPAPSRGASEREARPPSRARPRPVAAPQVLGLVLDEARRPLPSVTVLAEAENHYGYAEAFTDDAGRFAFGALAAGRWYVHADDERFARAWWRTHSVAVAEEHPEVPAELELVLRARHDVRGTIVDPAALPVAGATVTLVLEWPAGAEAPLQGHLTQELAAATTDEQGAFALERLGAGKWTARLDHPAFARTLARFEVPGPPPRLALDGGTTLDGLVLAGGAPLAGVRVAVRSTRQSQLPMGDWDVTTDAAGGFRVERITPVGESRLHGVSTVTVSVDDPAWRSDFLRIHESAAGTLPRVVIEAFVRGEREPGPRDVGRDWEGEARRAGKPFGSAAIEVRLAGGDGGEEQVWLRGLSSGLEGLVERGSLGLDRPQRFEHLAAGHYRVWTLNGGGTNYAPATVGLAEGATIEVVLRPGEFELAGAITCAGRPLEAGSITARSIRDGAGQRASGSLAAGRYAFAGLVPGSYELCVAAEGALTQHFEAQVSEPATTLDLELPCGRIEGRLGFERTPEESELEVMVFPHGWYPESGNRGVFVAPDAAGRFAVRHLAPGDYVVSARGARRPVRAVVVGLASTAGAREVVLEREDALGVLRGRVTNPLPAGPRGGLSVAALRHEPTGLRRDGHAEVDASGNFRVELAAGRYDLLLSEFGGRAPFVLVPDVRVEADAETALAVTLPPGRAVAIVLSAESWTPRATWRLRIEADTWLPFVYFVGSEPEGRRAGSGPFQLPFGTYAVEADFGDAAPVVTEFTVVPGEGTLEVVLTRP